MSGHGPAHHSHVTPSLKASELVASTPPCFVLDFPPQGPNLKATEPLRHASHAKAPILLFIIPILTCPTSSSPSSSPTS